MYKAKKAFVPQSDDIEARLKQSIVGLVDKTEYKKIRERVEQNMEPTKPKRDAKDKGKQVRLSFADQELEVDEHPIKKTKKEKNMKIDCRESIDKWRTKQEKVKEESIDIQYSFWNTTSFNFIKANYAK
jgi:hypothetical protein